jgi:hypothetical protein
MIPRAKGVSRSGCSVGDVRVAPSMSHAIGPWGSTAGTGERRIVPSPTHRSHGLAAGSRPGAMGASGST